MPNQKLAQAKELADKLSQIAKIAATLYKEKQPQNLNPKEKHLIELLKDIGLLPKTNMGMQQQTKGNKKAQQPK
jgi:uncharacterized protein (DUF2345 family)